MSKLLSVVLIMGFLAVDSLFFHDILKPGEIITMPQYLTGLLSVPVFVITVRSLLDHESS